MVVVVVILVVGLDKQPSSLPPEFVLCTSTMAMLCYFHFLEALRSIMFRASQSDSATHIKINNHSSLHGAPFIIVREGGAPVQQQQP